jgi:hypothetical protein
MENTKGQVALVAWKQGRGFAGEPLDYVDEVHYFNSKKAANEFQVEDWKVRGCPMDGNNPIYDKAGKIVGMEEVPEFRFQRVQHGTGNWKYAIVGYIEEMDSDQIRAWVQ